MKLVREKMYDNGLSVLKYERKVFYNNLWNETLVKFRGLVVSNKAVRNIEGFLTDDIPLANIVSYPFDKVFNYGENDAGASIALDEYVLTHQKVNGFLAVVSVYNDELLVSTTGTLDSDFAKLAKEVILAHGVTVDSVRGYTKMFEICHASDPHIIEEEHEVYFIGARNMQTMEMATAVELSQLGYTNIANAKLDYLLLGDLLEKAKRDKTEGWMIYASSGEVLKLKTKFYLVTKFLARNKRYINNFFDKDIKPLIVDEEYFPLLDFIKENYTKDYWLTLKEKAKVDIITQVL